MSEKFSLRWNDFKDSVSRSFGLLRQEKDFFDVTLVTQDEVHISAHKVILSASSQFFKNILRKSPSKHPMIFLSGINSQELSYVMDYVYQGEVQVYQEQLDNFLECASKLNVNGLNTQKQQPESPLLYEETQNRVPSVVEEGKLKSSFHHSIPRSKPNQYLNIVDKSLVAANFDLTGGMDLAQLEHLLKENLFKQDGLFHCKLCGKSAKQSIEIKNHIEATHIEGLSFQCQFCNATKRSRVQLRIHISYHHKNMSKTKNE